MAETQPSSTVDDSFAGRAKAGMALVFALLAVLGGALWSFLWYQANRKAMLEQQYARSAARLGQQVELRYENDRQIVDNIMRVLASADSLGTEQRSDVLNRARAAADKQEQWQRDAKLRVEASQFLIHRLDQAGKDVMPADVGEQLRQARKAAEQWAKAARAALAAQNQVDLDLLRRADQAVDDARKRVEDAVTGGAATVPSGSPGVSSPCSAANAASGGGSCTVSEAERLRDWAQFDVAEKAKEEHAAYLVEKAKRQDALNAWRVLKHRLEPEAATEPASAGGVPDAQARGRGPSAEPQDPRADALAEVEASLAREQAAEEGVADPSAGRDAAASKNEREAARELRRRVEGVVFPSYRAALERCESNTGLQAMALCLARKIAEMNTGSSSSVEIVRCSSAANPQAPSTLPTLSEDGHYLLLPASETSDTPLRICGRVRVDTLLVASQKAVPFVPRPLFAPFDAVALLKDDGSALFVPATDSNVRLSSLKLDQAGAFASSSMTKDVALGAGTYRAFVQPLKVAIHAGGKTSNLIVAGFLPEHDLTRQSMEIELSSYLWVVLLLVVGILSLPLAKLWLVGKCASFSRFDVTLLLTSSLLTVLLSVVLLLSFVAHNRLGFRAGQQTEYVASKLRAELEATVANAGRNLAAVQRGAGLVREIADEPSSLHEYRLKSACSNRLKGETAENVLFFGDPRRWPVCLVRGYTNPELAGDWKLAYWVNSLGYEQLKFVPSDHASVPVSVAGRRYFRQAKERQMGCVPAPLPAGTKAPSQPAIGRTCFAAEVVRSITSGETVLVAAQPIATGSGGVAAIQMSMNHLRRLVLPIGLQALVIDREGVVMLHSRDEAAEGQDLFADLDQPTVLRAAIANQTPSSIEVRYLGVPSRVRVQPLGIPGLGWSVLVFAPHSIVDVATTDMVLASLLGFGGIVVLVLVLACLCVLLFRAVWVCGLTDMPSLSPDPAHKTCHANPPRQRHLFRPRREYSTTYAAIGLSTLRWSGLLCLIALVTEGWVPTILQLLLNAAIACWALARVPGLGLWPWLSAHMQRVLAWLPTPKVEGIWRSRTALTYALYCFGMAAIFVVTPTTILFAGAYDLVVDTLVRAEESHLAAELSGKVERLDEAHSKPGCEHEEGEVRVFAPDHVTEHGLAPTWGTHRALWPMLWIAELLPPLGCPENQTLGRLYQTETEPPLPPPAALYELHRYRSSSTMVVTSTATLSRVSAPVPTLRTLQFHGLKLVATLGVFCVFLCAAIGTTIQTLQRLFFFRRMVPRASATAIVPPLDACDDAMKSVWEACEPHDRCLLAQLAIDGYVNPHPSNGPAVEKLVRRGIIDCQSLSFANPAFEEMIRHTVTSEERRSWEASDKNDDTWQKVRAPLIGAVVALFSAIAMSKPELGAASAVVPTVAVSLPAVVQILLKIISPPSG